MKKNIKKLALMLAAVNIFAVLKSTKVFVVEAAQKDNKTNYADGWNYNDGKWMFSKDGILKTDWFKDFDGQWYYFDDDGIMQTGWLLNNNNWYYLKDNGSMAHNCYINNYYLNNSGAWTSNIPEKQEIESSNLSTEIKSMGYSSVERIIDYDSSDSKYSAFYRYVWSDGKKDNGDYAVVNIFDSGSYSIMLRKNGTTFNENLKKIFNMILPESGDKLFNEVESTKEDKTITLDGKNIKIVFFDDSIGISID